MKKLFLLFLAGFLIACNNEGNTDATNPDSTTVEKDNTVNRDTGINNTDTLSRQDSVK